MNIVNRVKICLLSFFLFFGGMSSLYATTYYSKATGLNANSTSSWNTARDGSGTSPSNFTTAGDVFIIQNGHTLPMSNSWTVTGSLTIESGGTLTVSQAITIGGTTTISGTLNITTTTGTRRFTGLLTVNSGGTWNNGNVAEPINFRGGVTNNGTFTAGSGVYTFDTNNQTISGTLSIPSVTVTTITLTNNGTLSVTTALAGTGRLTQSSGSVLNIGGPTTTAITISTLTATASGNTVNYNGAAQTLKATTYDNLTLSGTGAKTFPSGTTTVNNVLSIENGTNTNTFTGSLAYGTSATLQYNAGSSNRTVSTEWPATFNGTGGVVIKGTGTITLNGAKTLGLNVSLNINSGAKLTTNNNALTFGGDFINDGTFTAGSSNITIANTAATQSIAGFTTTGTVSMTKTSGTATFTGNVSAGAFSLNGTGGTLNCGSGLTHTFTGTFDITAGTLQGGSSTIKINGTPGAATGNWVQETSTVDYGGTNQAIFPATYYNLVFSSGTKSLSGLARVEKDFTNNATFTPGTSTFSFVGTSPQTLGGSSATTFYILTINNTGSSGNNTVMLQKPTTVTNTLTLVAGIVNTTSTNLLSVTNTANTAISGGSSTSFVNGPLKWSLPASLAAGTSYIFPVGAGTNYYPFTLVNPTTGATAPTVQIEAKAANSGGTFDGTLFSLSSTEYWTMTTTGNFTNSSVSISRPNAISPFNVIAGSTSASGTYTSLGGTAGTNGVTNSNLMGSNRYFTFGRARYLTLSPTSLTGFTYPEGNGPSGIQNFTVNADGLTENITISAPTDFEVSLSGGTSFTGSSQVTIPIVSGSISNVSVYVRMKAGLSQGSIGPEQLTVSTTGFTTQTINLSGTVTARPVITLSTSSLSGFAYVFSAGPSAQQSFTVSGTNLSGNVTLTAPVHYEISTTSGSGFTSSISLTPSGGTLSSTTIYVRLKVSLGVGIYNETLTAASQYADTKNLSLNGNVTAAATLTTTPAWLACFIYTSGSGPSASQTFSLSGSNLGTNTVTVTAPTNFEISTNGTTFSNSFTLTPSGGAISQTVYARLKSGLAVGTYGPSNVSLACTGAVTKTVALNGQVVSSATVLVSRNTVTGFGYKFNSGPSPVESLTISGASLGSNNITVTPPSNYEISTSAGSGFQSTAITLTQSSGKVNPTAIYIRLKSGLAAGTYNQTLTAVSGTITQNVTLNGKVYATPLITASGGGDYCSGTTINLTSTGADIVNRYWSGPNNFYSTAQNPSIANSTPAMSGTYSVTGNVITGGNLIVNGDFEMGNVAISSSYGYPAEPFTTSSLVPEGLYAIVNLPSTVHSNFTSTGVDHTTGTGKQMVVNGATNPGVVVWSQSVAVVANADYEFTYWVQTVVNGNDPNPAQLQLYVNGIAAGPINTANPTTAVWTQFIYNTNAGSNTVLNLELVNQNTIPGGNDFSLDDIVFHQILSATASTNVNVNDNMPVSVSISYSPSVVYTNTPVTFTATPTNGGSSPVYEWTVNGTVVGTNSSTYTYTPKNGDVVSCKLTSSYPCAIGNPATSSKTMTVLIQNNYWMGAVGSTDWGTASNWTAGYVPLAGDNVEYATVSNYGTAAVNDLQLDGDRTIGSLINASDKNLVVTAGKQLSINGVVQDGNSSAGTIIVKSDPSQPTGTILFANPGNNPNVGATVEFYNKAYQCQTCGYYKQQWQYFGIPVSSAAFPTTGVETVNQYVEPWNGNKWRPAPYTPDTQLKAFKGYEMTNSGTSVPTNKYNFAGTLNTSDVTLTLTKTNGVNYSGMNLFSNSYTGALPINTTAILGSGMAENTVYLFNAGTRDQWRKLSGNTVTGVESGQYLAVPFNQAGQGGLPDRIPSMQSFMLLSADGGGTATLKYNQLTKNTLVNGVAWRSTESENSMTVTHPAIVIEVIGSRSADRVWLFEESGATRGFDNGWDAYKIDGSPLMGIYGRDDNEGKYQVMTVPEFEGTKIGITKEDNTGYTIGMKVTSEVSVRGLYLTDRLTGRSYPITDGAEYRITGTNVSDGNRFEITASATTATKQAMAGGEIRITVTNEAIVLDNGTNDNCKVSLIDITGRTIADVMLPSLTTKYYTDISSLQKGVYIVKVVNEKGQVVKTERALIK